MDYRRRKIVFGFTLDVRGTTFVPYALKTAVQGILARLYSDFRLNTQDRDGLIRQRASLGERPSDLAREYSISPQRVYQILRFKQH